LRIFRSQTRTVVPATLGDSGSLDNAPAEKPDLAEASARRDRRRVASIIGSVLGLGIATVAILGVALILPPFFIRETLSESKSSWIYFGHPLLYSYFWTAWLLFFAGLVVVFFVGIYDPKDGIKWQIASFPLAILGNIWLGFAIWLLAVKLFHIPAAVSDSRRFGLMVWWNLLHAIPLLNIDSALDWEQPMEEYDASIGWLLLLQQIVLLLTLARALAILVDKTLSPTNYDSDARAYRKVLREFPVAAARRAPGGPPKAEPGADAGPAAP
jgi:hypothetical protein